MIRCVLLRVQNFNLIVKRVYVAKIIFKYIRNFYHKLFTIFMSNYIKCYMKIVYALIWCKKKKQIIGPKAASKDFVYIAFERHVQTFVISWLIFLAEIIIWHLLFPKKRENFLSLIECIKFHIFMKIKYLSQNLNKMLIVCVQ